MLSLMKRKNRAIRNWHSKAMLVDPQKTRISIIGFEGVDQKITLKNCFKFPVDVENGVFADFVILIDEET